MGKLPLAMLLALLGASLAGCGAGARPGSLPVLPGSGPRVSSGLTAIRIVIPKETVSSSSARRPQYVSPATTQMTIDVQQGGVSIAGYPQTVGLTPTSSGCTSTLASTLCVLIVALAPGSYTTTIALQDASNAVLSAAQTIPFTVIAGTNNAIDLTLSGVPHSISVTSGAPAVHGSQGGGFTLYGLAAQPVLVTALDADGNYIIGPGSPTFTASMLSGSGFTIANPTTSAPNTVKLTPPGTNGTGEVFSLTAAYSDGTCSLPGAVCSATFTVKNDVQSIFVANQGTNTVTEYTPPYTGTPTSISNGVVVPTALAMDSAGDLFVASRGAGVTEYAPPYTGTPTTIANGVNQPSAMVLDGAGDLFVANYAGYTANAGAVTEYAPPYTGTPTTITTGVSQPRALTLDAAGDLFVANGYTNTVTEYAAPYTGTPTTISTGVKLPIGLTLDASGRLFVANLLATVTENGPPYTGTPTTISSGVSVPIAVTLDGSGNLFVVNQGNNKVTEYAPPYTGSPTTTISNNVNGPSAGLLDGAGNFFVANQGNGTVTEYAPPYGGSPTATISTNNPVALLLTP